MGSTELHLWRAYDPDRPYTRRADFDPLSGEGASLVSGRWHTARPDKSIVYASEHPALALLELYVNLEHALKRYALVEFTVGTPGVDDPPEEVANSVLDETVTRAYGDAWYAGGEHPVLRVPSALVPSGFNYLVRPGDVGAIEVIGTTVHPLDVRLAERL